MAEASWEDLVAGRRCPFDAPRPEVTPHWALVRPLTVSSWYLPVNQMYRGHGVLVFDPRHVTRLDELTTAEWHAYAADLHRVVTAIVAVCKPDHINVESLGNVMPHLHWHVFRATRTMAAGGSRSGRPTSSSSPSAGSRTRIAACDVSSPEPLRADL